ncbi:hypothetical protein, partial [Mycobacterium nebraskense]|uniref:hypothetical protein n=1 Tax=Mycobacterium nebraskense TaxID=244292 RepID=UPI001ABF4C52
HRGDAMKALTGASRSFGPTRLQCPRRTSVNCAWSLWIPYRAVRVARVARDVGIQCGQTLSNWAPRP